VIDGYAAGLSPANEQRFSSAAREGLGPDGGRHRGRGAGDDLLDGLDGATMDNVTCGAGDPLLANHGCDLLP
jgi:hypothetical protein